MSSNDGIGVGLNSQLSTKELLPNNHDNDNDNGNGNGNGKKKKRKKSKNTRRHTNNGGEHSSTGFYQAGLAGAGSISASDILINSVQQKVHRLAATDLALSSAGGEGTNYDGTDYSNVDVAPAVVAGAEPLKIGFLSMFNFSTFNEKIWMIVGIFSAAVAGMAMPVWLLLLSKSLETFNDIGTIVAAGGDISILQKEMNKLIYSFAIVGFVTLISGTCYVAIWSYTGEAQTLRIRKAFVKSALRQEAAWFDTRPGGGDPQELPVLAANGLSRIQTSIGRAVADTFSNLLSAIGCLMVSLGLDPPLALFMLCVLPLIAIIIGIVSCYMRRSSGKALSGFASAGAFASEVLTGIKTIASLRAENWAVQQYTEYAIEAQKYSIRSQILSKLASGLMGLLFYITYTFAFVFGTEQAASRAEVEQSYLNPFACMFRTTDCGISGSEVMVCIYGVILTAQFIALMNPGLNAINLGRTAAVDIYGTIHRTPAIDGTDNLKGTKLLGGGSKKNNNYDGSMEFKNVVFSYPSRPGDLIFANFSSKIKAGTAVALVGPSGSGKSTLSKLLLRLYDPIGGHVMAGGVPLTELNLKWWRSQIGYVAQEPSLFPGSIRDNIAAGKVDGITSNEEVIQAAMAASAHEFITDLPDGYDTFYSGSSIQLSGGQIQRIAIARAMIRNPVILILDEATSALDTQSERLVQEALDRIRAQRKLTTVTVAHRLSTIVNSDQIAVIADGSIQELGTHKNLIKEGGIYALLCEGQGLTADAASNNNTTTKSSDSTPAAIPTLGLAASPKEGAIETSMVKTGNEDDVEAGIITIDEEEDDDDGVPDTSGVLSRLWQYNKAETGYTILGYLGGMIVGALPACEAILFGIITGNFYLIEDPQEMRATNFSLSLWFLVLAAASFVANIAMGVGFGISGFRLTRRMRVLVFQKIMQHNMGWFDFPEYSTGELTTRLEEDSEAVSNVTGWQQGQRVQVFSTLTAGMVVTLVYSWQIGLIAICCIPFILGTSILQAKCASRQPTHRQEKNSVSAATLLERAFHDIVVLQAYGLQDDASMKYSKSLEPDSEFKKKQGFYNGLAFGISQFAVFSTFAVIFWAGIQLMINLKVGFMDFFVSLLAVMFSALGAGQTGADFSSRQAGLEAAARLFEIVDGSADEDDPLSMKGSKPSSLSGKVEFKACHFAYPTRPNAPVYYERDGRDGLTLDIPSQKSVAFTGRSGCGKSTALQLLLRFYRVESGSVLLDEQDISDVNIGWLRNEIGYVGQMPVLFAGTIRDNIKLGKPNATQQEIIDAAKAANAHDFVSNLNNGYDTDIGTGGSLLSGGQKQRIAIARAIVKDPKILVLDEATSALDNESEKIVQAALDAMQEKKPRTTLVVAHRLETVKKCDKIVVLDRGGVKEQGSHAELLKQKGLYHTLWSKQGGKEE